MIRISQIKLDIDKESNIKERERIEKKICSLLRVKKEQILDFEILKISIDARKGELKYVYQVEVKIDNEKKIVHKIKNNNI